MIYPLITFSESATITDNSVKMSTTLELEPDRMPEHDEDVFDERMNELLKSAETRLRQGITTQSQTVQLLKQPKLNTGELTRPYITTAGDVSRIDSSILVKKDERALLNEIRRVEVSPSKAEKKNAEVSLLTLHCTTKIELVAISFGPDSCSALRRGAFNAFWTSCFAGSVDRLSAKRNANYRFRRAMLGLTGSTCRELTLL